VGVPHRYISDYPVSTNCHLHDHNVVVGDFPGRTFTEITVSANEREGEEEQERQLSPWERLLACRARSLLWILPTESLSWLNPVVVDSRLGASCVKSDCNHRSRSSTVVKRVGFSFLSLGTLGGDSASSSTVSWVESAMVGISRGWSDTTKDFCLANFKRTGNPWVRAANTIALQTRGRMIARNSGYVSASMMYGPPGWHPVAVCVMMGTGVYHAVHTSRKPTDSECSHVAAMSGGKDGPLGILGI